MKTISKILSIVLCLAMVMALFVVGASADENIYTKVNITSASDITAGTYIIGGEAGSAIDNGSKYAYISNTVTSNRLKGVALTATNGTVTTSNNAVVWNLVEATGGFYLQSAANSQYVKQTENKKVSLVASASDATVWTVVSYNGGYTLKSASGYLTANRFGSAGSYYIGFAPYTASSSSCPCKLDFYKLSSGSVAACTHEGTGRVSVKDANNHWDTCQSCGALVGEKAAHTYTNGVCSCGYAEISTPVAGTTYKAGTFQSNLGKTIYITGAIANSRFLATTENRAEGVDVTVEAATGGFYLSFMDGTAKKYIDLKVTDSAQGYVNVVIADAPGVVYTFDATHKTFVATLTTQKYGEDIYFIGANGTYDTLGSSHDGNLGSYFPLYLYAIETSGGTGTEHTHNMVTKYDNTHHWTECSCGEKTDKVGHTLNNSKCACGYEKAAVVGYYKVTDGKLTDGKYVLVISETKVAAGIMNDKKWVTASNPTISGNQVANPTDCVWTLDVDGDNVTITDPNGKSITNSGTNIIEGTDTWKWKYENGMFYFYKEAEEGKEPRYLSSNPKAGEGKENFFRAYYLTLEPDSYGNFYYAGFDLYKYSTSGNPSTGDNSVVSVAVAAAVLSVMGAAVLVSKKKEF